jgi:rhodanese-related sulfurtransferase
MKNTLEVTPAKAFAMIKKGALLVDVREPREVDSKSSDVPEVLLIPLRQLEQRFQEIPVDRPVIIACQHGSRGLIANRFLLNHGYSKAVNMQSGMVCWVADGLPVKGASTQKAGSWLSKLFSRIS